MQLRSASHFLAIVLFLIPAAFAEEKTTPVHLVGHEDHELLARVQDLIDDWDPRKLVNPLAVTTRRQRLKDGRIQLEKQLLRPDLAEFIADVDAAEVLGKAFFWEMQAGSDFRRLQNGKFVGTACASCHFKYGADPRVRHAARIPYVAWNGYKLHKDHPLEFGEKQLPYDVQTVATTDFSFNNRDAFGNLSLILGSAGVEPKYFERLKKIPVVDMQPGSDSEASKPRSLEGYPNACKPEWAMFREGEENFRQITARNSPSVINSVFSDRLFHDGRAESTFNGFSIFGDRDHRPVLFRGTLKRDEAGHPVIENGDYIYTDAVQVDVAIVKAALASQAVGPIVNEVEMSYLGRAFPNVACKLLDAHVLATQEVKSDDSLLGRWSNRVGREAFEQNKCLTYRQLIKRAFRREWWDGGGKEVPLAMFGDSEEDRAARGEIMVANFSLYWGLSIMMYEGTLVSNQSPFDGMMVGNPTLVEKRWEEEKDRLGPIRLDRAKTEAGDVPFHKTGTAVFQHGFRVFLNRGCVECHSGPLFSELYERKPEDVKFPINKLMSHTLIPNSRADAIAIERSEFHEQILGKISLELQSLGGSPLQAMRWAKELDSLREGGAGSQNKLTHLIEERLQSIFSSSSGDVAKQIATLLLEFERKAPLHVGKRKFFSEQERVELAELLTKPVLVENMPIPRIMDGDRAGDGMLGDCSGGDTDGVPLERRRPHIPFKGDHDHAKEPYAFYDTSFYAIGLSPPRYDRGNGGRVGVEPDEEKTYDYLKTIYAQFKTEESQRKLDFLSEVTGQQLQTKQYSESVREKNVEDVRQAIEAEFDKLMQDQVAPQPNTGIKGSAYRMKSQYSSIADYAIAATLQSRSCEDGPKNLLDLEKLEIRACEQPDRSWDRTDIPKHVRRSSLVFFSRSRTLVADEEPWGYRKPFLHDNELAFWGAFKTPTLRNVELTGPYMHNGILKSLSDVIDFYNCAGFLAANEENYPDKHPEIVRLNMTKNDRRALEFFLLCLTDERVRHELGPFDHPSLNVVSGYHDDLSERVVEINAVGREGKCCSVDGSQPE